MIAVSRLRRVEHAASVKREQRRIEAAQAHERYELMQDLLQKAEVCRQEGDLSNDLVRRADRVLELLERGRQRLAENERART